MKKNSYLSYFGEIAFIGALFLYVLLSNYDSYDLISVILLILIYICMAANVYYTIKAKQEHEDMGLEIFSYIIVWLILLMSLIAIIPLKSNLIDISLSIDAPIVIFMMSAVACRFLVLPVSLIIMIVEYYRLFIKKKELPNDKK